MAQFGRKKGFYLDFGHHVRGSVVKIRTIPKRNLQLEVLKKVRGKTPPDDGRLSMGMV